MFGIIIVKAKLIELLMLCHVLFPEELVFFEPFCIKFLSAKRISSLHLILEMRSEKKDSSPRPI